MRKREKGGGCEEEGEGREGVRKREKGGRV